jgi:hypothetical protein
MTNTQCLILKCYEMCHNILCWYDTDSVRYTVFMYIHDVHESTAQNEPVSEALSYSRWREVKCFMLTSCTASSILSCILNILSRQVDGMEYDV